MIHTRKELDFYIKADRMMNRGVFEYSFSQKLKHLLIPDRIMQYLYFMRMSSYYGWRSREGAGPATLMALYCKWRKSKLGLKLGFSIGSDVFGYGLVIPHYGTIVVGPSNKIGNYAVLHTSTCISDNSKVIGDGLYLATGAKITSSVTLGNGVTVAANAVVNKDCADNVLLTGMPAVVKKTRKIWFEEEGGLYLERVEAIRQAMQTK